MAERSPRDVYCEIAGCDERKHLCFHNICPQQDPVFCAAPELLDALKDCRDELFKRIDHLTTDMPDDVRQKYLQFPPIVKADAAIAKAESRRL
jgi:hypothetical protein